jgi:hypothetical protein
VSGANDKRGTQIVKFIAGFVVALAIVAGAALAVMYTGSYNVVASVPAFIATARRAKIRPISLKALILKRPICQILAV